MLIGYVNHFTYREMISNDTLIREIKNRGFNLISEIYRTKKEACENQYILRDGTSSTFKIFIKNDYVYVKDVYLGEKKKVLMSERKFKDKFPEIYQKTSPKYIKKH